MSELEAAILKSLPYSNGEYSLEDIMERIEKRLYIPLKIHDVFLCVEVHEYPQKRILNIAFASGDGFLDHLEEFKELLSNAARSLGCTELTCYGRPGWERALKRIGVTKLYTVLKLEI